MCGVTPHLCFDPLLFDNNEGFTTMPLLEGWYLLTCSVPVEGKWKECCRRVHTFYILCILSYICTHITYPFIASRSAITKLLNIFYRPKQHQPPMLRHLRTDCGWDFLWSAGFVHFDAVLSRGSKEQAGEGRSKVSGQWWLERNMKKQYHWQASSHSPGTIQAVNTHQWFARKDVFIGSLNL